MVIHKFPLQDVTTIECGGDATVLDADFQNERLVVWIMHEPEHPRRTRKIIEVLGTGEEWTSKGALRHIATRQAWGIVLHVFERTDLVN